MSEGATRGMHAPVMLVSRLNEGIRRIPPGLVYILSVAWAAWLFWLGATGGLGAEPINALEREYGDAALKLLVAGLAITPLRRFVGVNLLGLRRAIGVGCFFFVVAHVMVWALLDLQSLWAVWADIVKRPYVTIGMAAFLLLIPLAVTSNNVSIRRMGPLAWRRLHRLVYPAAILGAVHFLWIAKGFAIEPLVYMGLILALLALRLPFLSPKPRRTT